MLPNGLLIEGYLRAEARDYSMVFALLEDGTVPIVRQYKHGIGAPSLDLPAGYLDSPEEPPQRCAQRELLEETGIAAAEWHPLGHFVIDTNRGGTRAHIYLATGASQRQEPALDPSESLEVVYANPNELLAMVRGGEISSLASAAGIMLALDALQQRNERAGG